MHTVEQLEATLAVAKSAGYQIRQEWLGGAGGGGCQFGGQKWLFLDLALGPAEQLDQVVDALRDDPSVVGLAMPEAVRTLLGVRKTA
ncbi:MAG: hypothetical protein JW818_22890 [Pirellulales bacterium]|nr:hypothetical protein [Pirellulales bacterium]